MRRLATQKAVPGNAEIITENDIKLPLTAFEHSNLNVRLNVFEGTYTLKGNVIPLINTNNEIGAGECVGSLIIELQDGTVLQTSSCFVTFFNY